MNIKEVNKDIERLSEGINSRFLLTVSGGADSVAMLDIFSGLGYDCIVAHCNFHLRGEESDRDECFVKDLAKKYSLPLFIKSFKTKEYATENSLSIEMAARELRYAWFNELCDEQNCDYIVVAHHAGDVVETVFINLLRGTGIKGIVGISEKNGKIIRPFLKYSREDIQDYLAYKGLSYCEDSTNIKTDYIRNKIRHNIIPVFKDINPVFLQTMLENTSRFRDVEALFKSKVKEIQSSIVSFKEDVTYIDLEGLVNSPATPTILFEILKEYNFGSKIIDDIYNSIDAIAGKQFYSPSHKLVKDREQLIIYPLKEKEFKEYIIKEGVFEIDVPISIKLEYLDINNFVISRESNIACFDVDKIKFPLIVRKWRTGDLFYPFGMKGKKKKVSDYFTDKKFSLKEKEDVWILEIDGKIAWIIGHRLDDRFCITTKTEKILKITLN